MKNLHAWFFVIMLRAEAYGSSFVCLLVIMPRAELPRYTVIVLVVLDAIDATEESGGYIY